MPELFVFLFKVNLALLLFCAGYYLVLRRLTFYALNRIYLVTAIVFATLFPRMSLTGFAENHTTLIRPVQNAAVYWQVPADALTATLKQNNYWVYAEMIFWLGAALLGFRLLLQLISLYQLHRRCRPSVINGYRVRITDKELVPFSFLRGIYVNPERHSPLQLAAVLEHEQVHVNGLHTIDIMFAELSTIIYWFNPGAWLMKKAVRENLEFITDRMVIQQGFDSKTYQFSLLNITVSNHAPGFVNCFNISGIKKRIMMMNSRRSSRVTLARYAFVIPAVVLILAVITLSKDHIRISGIRKTGKIILSPDFRHKSPGIAAQAAVAQQRLKTASVKPIVHSVSFSKKANNFFVHTVRVPATGEPAGETKPEILTDGRSGGLNHKREDSKITSEADDSLVGRLSGIVKAITPAHLNDTTALARRRADARSSLNRVYSADPAQSAIQSAKTYSRTGVAVPGIVYLHNGNKTELKDISAADILRVEMKPAGDTTKKAGPDSKNKVVYIYNLKEI
jgi:hypothetical protein